MNLAPLMFISHGSPMFALIKGQAAQNLANQSKLFDNVDAILIVSPHWITSGNYVVAYEKPNIIYDFSGFSPELYQVQYPAKGSTDMSQTVINWLNKHNFESTGVNNRGWDHGVWVPLLHLRPQADKPVVQLSLNRDLSSDQLAQLGKVLGQLRAHNIGIICSGSLTHNLYDIRMGHQVIADYASRFETWARDKVRNRELNHLKQPQHHTKDFIKSHPTAEHYLPLIIAMAASDSSEEVQVLQSPILHHTISMESYLWTTKVQ